MDLRNPSMPDPTAQNRRQFLQRTSAASIAAVLGLSGRESTAMTDDGNFESDPFSLGVASGDPLPDSVILWTRLAPEPLTAGGGMPDEPVDVGWTIAADEDLETIVGTGTATAHPDHAHTVHVEARGLEPATEYYYQFEAGADRSPVGRTKTAPAPGSTPDAFQFAFVSCQAWTAGHYTAHRYMAEDELDLIIHLGDYIYEYGIGPNGGDRDVSVPPQLRSQPESLERYRMQYGLYKSDPDLKAAHASAPWLITRDDHEVDNNWAGEVPQDPGRQDTGEFMKRRAAAFKVYYEHMPFRPPQEPFGPHQKLFRNYQFGDLLEINVLDTRHYRTNQVCGDPLVATDCDRERLDKQNTILGDKQKEWLLENLRTSDVTWDVIANQVKFSEIDRQPGPAEGFGTDDWGGYVADRNTVKRAFEDYVENPVIVTGDIHLSLGCNIKSARDPSDTVGAEFVGTSISSNGDGVDFDPIIGVGAQENKNMRYFNSLRGYQRCTVRPDEWTTDYRVVEYVTEPDAPVRTDASLTVQEGEKGLQSPVPTIVTNSRTLATGDTGTIDIVARWFSGGLRTGRFRLSLTDSTVGTISDVTVAEAFGTAKTTIAEDGSSAAFSVADVDGEIEPVLGGIDIPLASLDITADTLGTSDIELTVERFIDNSGESPETATRPGLVVVENSS